MQLAAYSALSGLQAALNSSGVLDAAGGLIYSKLDSALDVLKGMGVRVGQTARKLATMGRDTFKDLSDQAFERLVPLDMLIDHIRFQNTAYQMDHNYLPEIVMQQRRPRNQQQITQLNRRIVQRIGNERAQQLKVGLSHLIKKRLFKKGWMLQTLPQQMRVIKEIPEFHNLNDGAIQRVANIYNEINPQNKYIRNFQLQINNFTSKNNVFIPDQIRKLLIILHASKALIPHVQYGPDVDIQYEHTDGYVPGQFSRFAARTQEQLSKKDEIIQLIIRQAVLSYQKKIKENIKSLKQFLKLSQTQKQILDLFDNETQIKLFLQNPLQFTIRQFNKLKNVSLDTQIKKYFKRRMVLRKSAQIDGKFIDIIKLRLKERFYSNRHLFIPVQNSNLFVRLSEDGLKTKVIFKNGKFFDEKQISYLGEQAKQQIIAMVLLYLKKQNIISEQPKLTQIGERMNKILQNLRVR